jgi:endonuclease I
MKKWLILLLLGIFTFGLTSCTVLSTTSQLSTTATVVTTSTSSSNETSTTQTVPPTTSVVTTVLPTTSILTTTSTIPTTTSTITSMTTTTTQTTVPVIFDTHLEITRYPFKVVYQLGDEFNQSGLRVNVVQSSGTRIPVSLDTLTLTGFDKTKVGLQNITISYNNLTLVFSVYVKEQVQAGNVILRIDQPTKLEYTRGDAFDSTGLVVRVVGLDESEIILAPNQYSITPANMNLLGEQTIRITALGLEASFVITIVPPIDAVPITMPYYQGISGLVGLELELTLRIIINSNLIRKSYDSARQILWETDRDPNNSNNLILVYLGTSVSGVWDGGVTWNREHVWPQSKMMNPTNTNIGVATDLHNLKPADPGINSSRGNRYYDSVAIPNVSFTPRAEVRGDLARILFYMVIMYDYLKLIDLEPDQPLAVYRMAMLSVLLQWHDDDPVDDFERNRNNVIFSHQKNRNPFIDYPHLVDLIW